MVAISLPEANEQRAGGTIAQSIAQSFLYLSTALCESQVPPQQQVKDLLTFALSLPLKR
jgi:hypothetical protein